jgi:hypothetical protein
MIWIVALITLPVLLVLIVGSAIWIIDAVIDPDHEE